MSHYRILLFFEVCVRPRWLDLMHHSKILAASEQVQATLPLDDTPSASGSEPRRITQSAFYQLLALGQVELASFRIIATERLIGDCV